MFIHQVGHELHTKAEGAVLRETEPVCGFANSKRLSSDEIASARRGEQGYQTIAFISKHCLARLETAEAPLEYCIAQFFVPVSVP